jgi:hypothetical protein
MTHLPLRILFSGASATIVVAQPWDHWGWWLLFFGVAFAATVSADRTRSRT